MERQRAHPDQPHNHGDVVAHPDAREHSGYQVYPMYCCMYGPTVERKKENNPFIFF